ncbi:MAG: helix-turn-helix domain-containing protein [Candidatus Bathyarchaeota archaeon]|nr:helix-turn-helix domain-containing protein [Candidatus Bathyarchaeota archaeon]MDH5494094.1 helix-turn-helix domain-containing protein [Candidatus Bathyarchaeota archaeon]
MTLYEVALKVATKSFFTELTRRFPSMSVFIWCNRENDVVEIVVRAPDEYPLVMEEIRALPFMGVIEEITDDRRLYLNVHECHCMKHDTIVRHIGKLDILNIFPNMIENGWTYHRLIVFRHKDLEELLTRFEKWDWFYKILRKVPFDGFVASSLTLSADALFSGLTEKQMEAILVAHRHGYYNLPRDSDVKTIAAKEKVPRTTFQEHLSKAENKLLTALLPNIKLFYHASPERRKSLRVKRSHSLIPLSRQLAR